MLGALQQWGDTHLPHPGGPSMLRRVRATGGPAHVGFVDEEGREVGLAEVAMIPAQLAGYSLRARTCGRESRDGCRAGRRRCRGPGGRRLRRRG